MNVDARLRINGMSCTVVVCLFADDTCLQSKEEIELINFSVCARRKLK